MDINGRNILMLGGSGLVGIAMARKLLPLRPARLEVVRARPAPARQHPQSGRRWATGR